MNQHSVSAVTDCIFLKPPAGGLVAVVIGVVLQLAAAPPSAAAQGAGPLENLDKPMEGRSMRATSTMREGEDRRMGHEKLLPKAPPRGDSNELSNLDNFRVAPGHSHVLLDEAGPGVINHLWMTFLGPEKQDWAKEGSANHQEILLRIYWDGRERPGVEAPVGDFFASCFGQRHEVISLPVVVSDGSAYNCFWPMPFRKSARIEIVNQSQKPLSLLYYNIDWVKKKSLPKDTPYFYAQYRQEYPVRHGQDYLILDTKGKGHYVGTVLAVRTRSPAWFGEGDEKIYIDGEKTASIWGTGTEDYFLMAWGLRPCNTPYYGCPYCDPLGLVGGRAEAYRWHINDPILFNTGIRVTMEHWGWMSPDENPEYKHTSWNEREDDYSSVAFWYQTGEPTFDCRAPEASQRRLPSLERLIVAAANFADARFHGRGNARPQQLDLYEDPQLLYQPAAAQGAWLEVHFTVTNKEPVRLLLNVTKAPDFGVYQASLNGVKLGEPLDFYSARIVNEESHLLDFWPDPGEYTLRLECTGQNGASSGCFCGIESLRLRGRRPRVTEMAHDKDKDWRKDPKLYD
ncbi:MAG TPA: glycoside hydrolase family 172 protein [Candidatus Acidoferrum sp.]|nr:glycoside hydrolase family 172 protein [Candidatus Acidoferrum sp.]